MAIYIKYFQNMVDYQQFLNTADFVKPNVSSVEEAAQSFYHSVNKSLFLAKSGDVVLYDKVNKTKVAVAQNALNETDYPSSQFAPLGVVVIPASHDVYGTGECGIISINAMSYEHPDTGFSNEKIHWGGSGDDITTLSNYNNLPLIDSALLNNTIVGK